METVFVKPAKLERKWFVIDAEGKVLGRVAARAASIVRGKEKPIFAPHQEMGDFVVIVNAGKAALTGRKPVQKLYHRHTGYVGGLKTVNYEQLAARHPASPMELAVKGMLPKGPSIPPKTCLQGRTDAAPGRVAGWLGARGLGVFARAFTKGCWAHWSGGFLTPAAALGKRR